ncbi:sulfotransferase family 2 domain-containing protein [Petrachloros mirabilis]
MRVETYAIVDRNAGFAYVNLAKCGCSAIKTAIAEYLQQPFETVQSGHRWRMRAPVVPERLYRFTVMRDPRERLVSCWSHYICAPGASELMANPEFQALQGISFAEFATYASIWRPAPNLHYAPQWWQLHWDGRCLVDEILHLETIESDWPILMERFGLPELKTVNTSEHRPWREYYDNELLSTVESHYSQDMRGGGYIAEASEGEAA